MKIFTKAGKQIEFNYYPKTFSHYLGGGESIVLTPGWYRFTKKNSYKVFMDDGEFPIIWIGRYIQRPDHPRDAWYQCHSQLRLDHIELTGATIQLGIL